MQIKESKRARILGESSYGSTGQPYMVDFGNGISFRVSTRRVYFPDGSPFEVSASRRTSRPARRSTTSATTLTAFLPRVWSWRGQM
ncbi:MAG TPA: hypothetical protein VH988_19155 [Thermoanaerobaculia bacterium]|jgi:hypothetical protein|nr:hypothetical protein [Thermoanaerobaculia bacterium]